MQRLFAAEEAGPIRPSTMGASARIETKLVVQKTNNGLLVLMPAELGLPAIPLVATLPASLFSPPSPNDGTTSKSGTKQDAAATDPTTSTSQRRIRSRPPV
jgi:hypothetical protein